MAPDDSAQEKAQDAQKEREEAKKEVEQLEEDPPKDLEDWPDGKAKYETFGGPEGDEGYEDSATAKLGPSGVRHHEDGKVTVGGEEVDDPDDYKGEPIPGGPTDPDTKAIAGERDLTEENEKGSGGSSDDSAPDDQT
ncbi:MAG: hypothetical protein H0V85_00120 [Thermoleophilaceae bacterium]|jgi:hypothetical protein|nr:hypothetical protein [Thermoleophilaceae bacterium]